jgi:hypothetical protein
VSVKLATGVTEDGDRTSRFGTVEMALGLYYGSAFERLVAFGPPAAEAAISNRHQFDG